MGDGSEHGEVNGLIEHGAVVAGEVRAQVGEVVARGLGLPLGGEGGGADDCRGDEGRGSKAWGAALPVAGGCRRGGEDGGFGKVAQRLGNFRRRVGTVADDGEGAERHERVDEGRQPCAEILP